MTTTRTMLALAFAAISASGAAARAGEPDAKLSGTYAFAGGEAETKALSAAIEECVSKMNVMARGIARGRLEKGNAPTAEVKISAAGKDLTIARTGKPAITAPTDGSKVTRDTISGPAEVTYAVDGTKVVQTMQGKSSLSTNVFSARPRRHDADDLDEDRVSEAARPRAVQDDLQAEVSPRSDHGGARRRAPQSSSSSRFGTPVLLMRL